MLRLTIFIIALLLLAGTIEPSRAWFIALSVLAGLSLICTGPGLFFGWFGRGWRQSNRFARRMERRFERRFERDWAWDPDW